jgi:outer membrane protein
MIRVAKRLFRQLHLPVVELQLNYYNTNTGFQSANLGNQTDTQVAAINVNVPIFSGGTTTQRAQEAQHKPTLNKYDSEAKLRALIKETSDAFLTSNANVRRIKATRKALESAAKSREAMVTGFGYGVETISDVLKAQEEEFKAKRDLAKAK